MPTNKQALLGWLGGPLPDPRLEAIAKTIFEREYPDWQWTCEQMAAQRDECRGFALKLRIEFLKMDRWTIEDAHEQIAEQMLPLAFGEQRIGPKLRQEITDYCEVFMSDFWGFFRRRLFYPKEIEANRLDVEREDANGRR